MVVDFNQPGLFNKGNGPLKQFFFGGVLLEPPTTWVSLCLCVCASVRLCV